MDCEVRSWRMEVRRSGRRAGIEAAMAGGSFVSGVVGDGEPVTTLSSGIGPTRYVL